MDEEVDYEVDHSPLSSLHSSPSHTPSQEYEDNLTTTIIIQSNSNSNNSNINGNFKEEDKEEDEDKLNNSSISANKLSPSNNKSNYNQLSPNNNDIDINSEKIKIWNDLFSIDKEIKQIIIDIKLAIFEKNNEEDVLINLLIWLKRLSSNKDLLCRQAYNIFCALVESLLVKPELISIIKNKGIDSKKHLSFLIKFIVSKDELFKDREYDQLIRLIKKVESKNEYPKHICSKWKSLIEDKKIKMQSKLLKVKPKAINISNTISMASDDYTIYKSCKVIELLCFELKASIEDVVELKDFLIVEMTAYEILQRICFNYVIVSKDTAAVGTACLVISYKICRVKYDIKAKYIHSILNHILNAYWKIIGNVDPSIEYDDNNKNLYKLDLRFQSSILTKDSLAFDNFKTNVLDFEKTALTTIEYDFNQILPPNVIGGVLYSHIENLNLTDKDIRNIQSIFTNKAYTFSSLCIFEDHNNIIGACIIASRVRNSDDASLFEKLNVDRKNVKRVNAYMHTFKTKLKENFDTKLLLESIKINKFQLHALKVNKPIERYKEDIKSQYVDINQVIKNPFLSNIYSLPSSIENSSVKTQQSSLSSSVSNSIKESNNHDIKITESLSNNSRSNDRPNDSRNDSRDDSRSFYRDTNNRDNQGYYKTRDHSDNRNKSRDRSLDRSRYRSRDRSRDRGGDRYSNNVNVKQDFSNSTNSINKNDTRGTNRFSTRNSHHRSRSRDKDKNRDKGSYKRNDSRDRELDRDKDNGNRSDDRRKDDRGVRYNDEKEGDNNNNNNNNNNRNDVTNNRNDDDLRKYVKTDNKSQMNRNDVNNDIINKFDFNKVDNKNKSDNVYSGYKGSNQNNEYWSANKKYNNDERYKKKDDHLISKIHSNSMNNARKRPRSKSIDK